MTTVEAMAGGCVPVVIDKAGQTEIITPGVDGFRWSTPQQLMSQTERVAGDEELRARLSAAAVDSFGQLLGRGVRRPLAADRRRVTGCSTESPAAPRAGVCASPSTRPPCSAS